MHVAQGRLQAACDKIDYQSVEFFVLRRIA